MENKGLTESENIRNRQLSVIYLHGFASGPKSSKAVYFARELSALGVQTIIPDLNAPDFEHLTLTSQLEVTRRAIDQIPTIRRIVLIGSSMGGLVATLTAPDTKNLAGLILLAPGFGLNKRWTSLLGEEALSSWKKNGSAEVFNYAAGKKLPLHYDFFDDINKYETDELTVSVPTLIFHGKADDTVPISESEVFAKRNQDYVQLRTMDDDHQLLSSLEHMWMSSKEFLSSL
jgi:pimeloyl-ACP methyl ester carboxylesterase